MATRDTNGSLGGSPGSSTGSGLGASTTGSARETASNTVEQAKQQVGEEGNRLAGAARTRARSAFEHQQHRVADSIGSVAQALHQAADQLSERNEDMVARYTDTAAQRIEQFADSLRDRDLDDLIGQAEHFARRQPELFLGGAVVVGFAIARFLRTSGSRGARYRGGMGQGGYGGSHYGSGSSGGSSGGYGGGYDPGYGVGDTLRGSVSYVDARARMIRLDGADYGGRVHVAYDDRTTVEYQGRRYRLGLRRRRHLGQGGARLASEQPAHRLNIRANRPGVPPADWPDTAWASFAISALNGLQRRIAGSPRVAASIRGLLWSWDHLCRPSAASWMSPSKKRPWSE